MNRTIKFRGKRIDNGEWTYGDLIANSAASMPRIKPMFIDCDTSTDIKVVDPNTIGQFTGLTDKNGKEIYEGDILVWGENGYKVPPIIVMFKHGSFGYTYIEDWFHSFAGNTNFTFNPLNTDVRFEIVGNIHDNPELIKQNKEE